VHDAAVSHLPRLIAVALVIAFSASWMGSQVLAFAERAWGGG
jgi:flagellar biosynthesis protein FliQ